jgi:type VI secretion system protein ImpF
VSDPLGASSTGAWARRGAELERPVQQSLLDRLIDELPGVSTERLPTREESLRALKISLRRDLEWLLNSRRELVEIPEALEETRRSALRYGLPDVTSMPRNGAEGHARLARAVEEAITLFEPRLMRVKVTLATVAAEGASRSELRFIVEGVLRLDPSPERVVFDTVLELGKGEYQVVGEEIEP